jgi:hypothetical protein
MSYDATTFQNKVNQIAAQYSRYANLATELTAIATALGSDITTRDATLQTAPVAGLKPGQITNSHFTNDILLVVNRGKGGNLSNATMATAINAARPPVPPANTAAPVISGTGAVGNVLTRTTGTWTGIPAPTFTNQWLRGATNIAGATGANYTLVAADSGTNCSCRVTGTNSAGTANATSNAIACA